MIYFICIMFLLVVSNGCFGANILCCFICPAYSHAVVLNPIAKELSRRGHKVVAVTPNPLNDSFLTNLTEIDVSYFYNKFQKVMVEGFLNSKTYTQTMHHGNMITNQFTEAFLENEEFKKLYQNTENVKFDLVIVEAITQLVPAFGHKFNAPSIGIYSLEASLDRYSAMGGVTHPAIYGFMFLDFDYPISIWNKIQNTYFFLWHKFYMRFVNVPVVDSITKKYWGEDFPSILDLERETSMLFLTKSMLMNSVRPMPPNIVQLEFMHVQEPKPVAKDLELILNNSTQGVVYFSLGSNVKSSTLPLPIKNAIIQGLSELSYTVLWKWESENISGVSSNVVTRKWFPQQDVLAHPNVKVFVTQGGLQSSEEAIARSIPLVGIPLIADQEDNINKLVKLGVAIQLSLNGLTSDSLKKAIIEIVENKKYSKRMKELRNVALDQPMTGIERAVWWSEYVIRNKGAPALRSVLADVPLYEYLMLDVIAVVLLVLVLSLGVLKKIITVLRNMFYRSSKKMKSD